MAAHILRVSNYNFQTKLYFLSEELFFTITNSADPDEMPNIMWRFIWIFTVWY